MRKNPDSYPYLPGMGPEAQEPAPEASKPSPKITATAAVEQSVSRREYARQHCQYCQDVGLCTFCKRGQQEIQRLKEKR